ncbi:MAG: IS30 family transposase [Acaryochloris sp. RU_4_1]|nr:IS30 family transposase [Leptolyngbyaceae cyanobacterium SU_3_3]NJM68214.1 IS30 family transposase [Acaryochloris sp. RU_4_1]
MSYSHLSTTERFTLYQYRTTEQLTLDEIAVQMKRSKSTISRDLRRNSIDAKLYLPDTAQSKMQARRAQSKQKFSSISESTIEEVKQRLRQYHSPEQLSGRMKREGLDTVSHETIYQMIYANHQGLAAYQQYLRQGQTKRRRRKGANAKRGCIPGRIGIEHRPAIADLKVEIGHWESDTVIGVSHIGAIVTHVDKASKFLVAGLAKNKTVQQINQVTIALFEQIDAKFRKMMTFDNGKEFSGHQKLAQALGLSCFFANPYHSWERGLNEHTNGLLRQFFPKGTNFKIVKPEALKSVVDLINHRPRKSLDYRTPYEVFYPQPSAPVALQI